MTKGEIAARFAVDDTSRLTLARVLDRAELARTRDVPGATQFLTDGERALARQALAAAGCSRYIFWGGYPAAERRVCVFLPTWADWEPGEGLPAEVEDPLAAVEVPMPREGKLTHRDFLGAMMGLGLNREVTGDILVGEETCQVVCLRTALPILLSQWTEVGRHPIRPRALDLGELVPVEAAGRILRETFRSLRFDAVAAAGFGLSRAKAAALIASGRMEVNHLPCDKPDRILREGDTLTGRGCGKCRLRRVTGTSKKGRIAVELERY